MAKVTDAYGLLQSVLCVLYLVARIDHAGIAHQAIEAFRFTQKSTLPLTKIRTVKRMLSNPELSFNTSQERSIISYFALSNNLFRIRAGGVPQLIGTIRSCRVDHFCHNLGLGAAGG